MVELAVHDLNASDASTPYSNLTISPDGAIRITIIDRVLSVIAIYRQLSIASE
jgi:hypothetical protein